MKSKFIMTALIMISLFISVAYGETEIIDVDIVEFDVYVNDTKILTEESQYPVLSYNNITYFPLTFDYLSGLGLNLSFDESEGLVINRDKPMKSLNQKFLGSKNKLGTTVKARIADFKISVNGDIVDNSTETHPIITYKNVTYFPMTWRFAVEEFNWETSWSSSAGLKIVTTKDVAVVINDTSITEEINEDTVTEELAPVDQYAELEDVLVEKLSNISIGGKDFTIDQVIITETINKPITVTAYVEEDSLTNIINITIFKRVIFEKTLEQIAIDLSKELDESIIIDIRYEDDNYDASSELDVYNATVKHIYTNDDGSRYISFPILEVEYNNKKNESKSSFWFG